MTTTPQRSDAAPPAPTPRGVTDGGAPTQAATGGTIWMATRVVALILAVLETLLLVRFVLLLFGANASQPLVSFVYGISDPLVRPFQGIFAQPAGPPTFEVAAVLAIVFFLLLGALVLAAVRAVTGRRAGPRPSA